MSTRLSCFIMLGPGLGKIFKKPGGFDALSIPSPSPPPAKACTLINDFASKQVESNKAHVDAVVLDVVQIIVMRVCIPGHRASMNKSHHCRIYARAKSQVAFRTWECMVSPCPYPSELGPSWPVSSNFQNCNSKHQLASNMSIWPPVLIMNGRDTAGAGC